MKKMLITTLMLCLSLGLFAQKNLKVSKEVNQMLQMLKKESEISSKIKKLIPILAADDDGCSVTNCSGIIDPWTCECYDDIRDPWEEDGIARKLKAFQSFERELKMGGGKSIIMIGEYKTAQKKYPGQSLKAIVNRLNFYAQAAR